MGDMTAVRYDRLTPAARHEIRWGFEGATIAGYVRHYFPDGRWGGDKCGCLDDRCIGFHHDEDEECGCLGPCLDDWWLATGALVVWWVDVACGVECDIPWHRGGGFVAGPYFEPTARQVAGNWGTKRHSAQIRRESRA